MKGYVVREKMSSGTMDWVHGGGGFGKRIIVPEHNNLAITIYDGRLTVFDGYEKDENTKVIIEEIEVAEDLIQVALDFIKAKKALLSKSEVISNLMEE